MRKRFDAILGWTGIGLFGVCVVMLFLPTAWTHNVSWPIFCTMLAVVGFARLMQFFDEIRDRFR